MPQKIEMNRRREGRGKGLQASVPPVADIDGAAAPGAVFRPEAEHAADVGALVFGCGLAQGFVEKYQATAEAVAHGRLGDRHGHGKKPVGLVEKAAEIEPAVLDRA